MSELVQRLTACEEVIGRGLQTFVEVGNALLTIRDDRLYRESHDAFEDYCRERWGFSRQRAQQLTSAAQAVTTIVGTDLPAPVNEGQARELARVPEDKRSEVWRETVARTEGRPTAKAIRETYEATAQGSETSPPSCAIDGAKDTIKKFQADMKFFIDAQEMMASKEAYENGLLEIEKFLKRYERLGKKRGWR